MNILRNLPSQTHRLTTTWHTIQTNWIVRLVHKFVFLFFMGSVAAIIWRWRLLPPMVPLWYSRPWGTDQLAPSGWLFLLPLASLLWYGVTLLVATYVTAHYLIFTQMLFLSSFLVHMLSFITLVKILFLVT